MFWKNSLPNLANEAFLKSRIDISPVIKVNKKVKFNSKLHER